MGIEPTSAISASILRVAASLSTAARRLDRSAFGSLWHTNQRPTPASSPANQSLGRIALINLHIQLRFTDDAQAAVIPTTDSKEDEKPMFFKLCSDHLSVEAIPRKPLALDLGKIRSQQIQMHEIMMWTPHFVVLRNGAGQEITLRRDGRMIVRKAPSEQAARAAATDIMRILLRGSLS
jgi:hypothetical protein